MIRSSFQSTTTSIAILAAFLLFSPNFGHTVSMSLQETPTETPTATPTTAPTPIPHLVKIQTVDISSQSIGAVHPQTGDLYVGSIENFSIFHPSTSGVLSRTGSRTIGWSFWDYITIAEDSSIFATALHWEDFMAHSIKGKSYTLCFEPDWTGSLIHAVCSTDNIPGASVGDVLILKHETGIYRNSISNEYSIWRINYRDQKVERFPYIPADRLPPNIDDWTIGPDNKLYFTTFEPRKIFRLETDGSIRELNHGHIPISPYSYGFEYLPADGCFYVLSYEYKKTDLIRLSSDFQKGESVYSSDSKSYLSHSDVIAGKDGRTLYLLRPSVRKMDVLRYESPPTPTPTPVKESPTPIAGLFALNGYGEIRTIQSDIEPPKFPLFDTDIARDIEPDPKGRGWYMIDGFGHIYRTSNDLPQPDYAPIFNFDIIRNLEIKEKDGEMFFYILDGWGGVHTSDPDYSQQGLPYFPGEDIIRDLEPDPSTNGWLTADLFGQIYSTYGVIPTAQYARPKAYDLPFGRTKDGTPAVQAMIRLPNESTIAADSDGNLFSSAYLPPFTGFEEYQASSDEGGGQIWDVEIIPDWEVPNDYAIPTSTPTPIPTPLPEIAMTLDRELGLQGAIQSLHHDPAENRLLIGKMNGDLDVYNTQSWNFVNRISTGKDGLISAFFAPNGIWIYAGYQDGTVVFYDNQTNRLVKTIELNSILHCMTVGGNPNVIYIGLDDNQSVLIDGETGDIIKRYFHYEGDIPTSAAIDQTGLSLYLGTKDRIFQFSRINQTVNVFEWPGVDIQFSLNEDRLWTLGKSLALFEFSTQTALTQEPVNGTILKVSPDGDIAAVGDNNGVISIRHPDFDALHQWNAHDGRVTALEFTKYGNGIISAGEDGKLRVWTHSRENYFPTPTPTISLPISAKTFFYEKVLADKQGLREAIAVQNNTGDIYVTALGIIYRIKQPKNLVDDPIFEVAGTIPNGYEMNVETMAVTDNGTIIAADQNKEFLFVQYPNGNQKKITFPTLEENLRRTTIKSIYVAPQHAYISKSIKPDDVLAVVNTRGDDSKETYRIWRIDVTKEEIEPELVYDNGSNSFTICDITCGPDNRIYLLGSRRLYVLDSSGKPVEYTHFVFESLSGQRQLYPGKFTYLHGDMSFYLSASDCIFRLLGTQQNMYRIENLSWGEIADEIKSSPDGEWLYYIDKGNHKLVSLKHKSPLPIVPTPIESPIAIPTATPIPGWMVLDGYGGIHLTNPNSSRPNLPYFVNFDIVRDIEPDPLDRGWFMLDGYGGLHSSSPDLIKPDNMPYFAFDIARDVEFRAAPDNSLYFYVLDGFGIVHTNDPTFDRGYLPTFTSDKARSLEPDPTNKGWIMMDNEAIVYFDYMPWYDLPLNAPMKWDAKAKSLIRFRDHRSIILDAYGGRHINAFYPPHEKIQGLPEGFYFPGWDILWDVEMEK